MPIYNTVLIDEDAIRPHKTAIHVPLSRLDNYLLKGEGRSANSGFEHGRIVDAFVSKVGNVPHEFMVGNYLVIKKLDSTETVYGRIKRIRMMETDLFADEDYYDLGFEDFNDYAKNVRPLNQGRVWLLDIARDEYPEMN
jgi:hypothetical protein